MRNAQTALSPGTIIQGRYVIEGVLGSGNSDTVYLVKDQHVQQHLFALKEVHYSGEKDGNRFTFETTEIKKRFVHPALPQVYDLFRDDKNSRIYILMEYIEGSSLEEVRLLQPEQRFSLSQIMSILLPIIDAVIYLHSLHPPLIHGNIKPSNIIESTDASTILVNFDLGKEYDADKTIAIDPHATSGFEAPEQYIGVISPGTDIYSLGATLYMLLAGSAPIDAFHRLKKLSKNETDPLVPLNKLAPTVPQSVSEIIHRAISLSSDDRFSTVEQFWEPLQQASLASSPEEQITESAVLNQNEGKTELETHSLIQHVLEPLAGIEDASTLANDRTGHHAQEPAAILSDSSQMPVLSGTVKSRVTKPLQEPSHVHPFKQYGMLFLTMFAILITLLGSIGVGVSLRYYIIYHGSPSITSAPPLKRTPHSGPTSTVLPTPSNTSTNIAALYNGTIYDISANVTTKMSLTGIHQTQLTISGNFIGLSKTGIFNGVIDPHPPKHIQFMVKDPAGHIILSFDGHMQSDGELSGSYCNVGQNSQCSGGYGLWSVAPVS